MGVPALFRWLSTKYPKIISPVIEEEVKVIDGMVYPAKYENPNPNGELDNLYLDMNGIVHPCSHPENKPPPATEEEMMIEVFKYTDRVLNMARPRKVLMIAVDGVAPRAKMNQQRARRFRAAQDAKIQNEEKARQLKEMEDRGEVIDEAIKGTKKWDTNSITPGTPFMDTLAESLRFWVSYKLANDPGWANLQVIISDATVPGEGEHKIMNFVRSQRTDPEHNPNTSHCIYGLDADLIFLSLVNHEPHFRVLREDVFARDNRTLRLKDALNMTEQEKAAIQEMDDKKPFLWLHTSVLREYLEVELNIPGLQFKFDLERAIDDWVFMCFFVGNDFLPHLPSLDVRDNGIDILVNTWKRLLPQLKSYITCDGHINLAGVEKLLEKLALQEDGIFRRRQEKENRYAENQKRRQTEKVGSDNYKNQVLSRLIVPASKIKDDLANAQVYSTSTGKNVTEGLKLNKREMVKYNNEITLAGISHQNAADVIKQGAEVLEGEEEEEEEKEEESEPIDAIDIQEKNMSNLSAAAALKAKLALQKPSLAPNSTASSDTDPVSAGDKRKLDASANSSEVDSEDADDNGDTVKMYEPGYRDRYYKQKFHCTTDEEINATRREVVKSYIEGVCWVALYYTQGCPSWTWYYPYHYAPFAKDFDDLKDIEVKFKQGKPFRPYEQLMSVMPAASGHTLPDVFTPLMKDADSEIIDFYPEEFEIDMNGKKMSWQGIPLLPFIDEERLLKAVQAKYHLLTEKEVDRNTLKQDVLLIGHQNKNFAGFKKAIFEDNQSGITFKSGKTGLSGSVFQSEIFDPEGITKFKLNLGDYTDVDNKLILRIGYQMPAKLQNKSMLLTGFIPHLKMLTQEDKDSLIYGGGGMNQRYRNQKYNTNRDTDFSKNVGPYGDSMYTARVGGYKAWVQVYQQQQQQQTSQASNTGYISNGHYNNGAGYANQGGYNNRYDQGHGYNNRGYGNQRYDNQRYESQRQGNQRYNTNQSYSGNHRPNTYNNGRYNNNSGGGRY